MKTENNRKNLVGYYLGWLSIIFTTSMIIIAFLVSTEYNFYLKTISKLGIDPTGQYPFIFGTAVGGILLILFHILYFEDRIIESALIKRGRIFGMISGIGMIGVGVFPDYPNNFLLEATHFVFALIFFVFMTLSIIFYGLYLRDLGFKNDNDKLLYRFSLFVALLTILHSVFSFIKGNVTIGDFEFGISIIWQKITVFFLVTWYVVALFTNNSIIPQHKKN
jgi:hypothetical membrane protein